MEIEAVEASPPHDDYLPETFGQQGRRRAVPDQANRSIWKRSSDSPPRSCDDVVGSTAPSGKSGRGCIPTYLPKVSSHQPNTWEHAPTRPLRHTWHENRSDRANTASTTVFYVLLALVLLNPDVHTMPAKNHGPSGRLRAEAEVNGADAVDRRCLLVLTILEDLLILLVLAVRHLGSRELW